MVAGEPMAPVPLPQEEMLVDRVHPPPPRMIPGPVVDSGSDDMMATARGGGPPTDDVMQQPKLSTASPDAPPSSSPINTSSTPTSHEIGVGDDPIDPQPKSET